MNFCRKMSAMLGIFILIIGLNSQAASTASPETTLLQMHWLGLDRISADTNSAQFLKIWRLPETVALQAQTFDKLSHWLAGGKTNTVSAKLRPLLDDLVSSEVCLEFNSSPDSQTQDEGTQLLFAIHLPADRARLWQTNCVSALQDLTGIRITTSKSDWSLTLPHSPWLIKCTHHNGWTIIGIGQEIEHVLAKFAKNLGSRASSSAAQRLPATNEWLEADFVPSKFLEISSKFESWLGLGNPRQTNALGMLTFLQPVTSKFAHCQLTVQGKAGEVFSHGTMKLARPLEAPLPAWEIPTNLIHGPLSSFTAVRGLDSWLSGLYLWRQLQFSPSPNQAYAWVPESSPMGASFAFPLPGASNQLVTACSRLVSRINSWLAGNADGRVQWQSGEAHVAWNGPLAMRPYLESGTVNHQDYLTGGLAPINDNNAAPLAAKFVQTLLAGTNLVYYHAEQTGSRVDGDLFVGQTLRMAFHKPQLPFHSPSGASWLKSLEPLLGTMATSITQTSPRQFNFTRSSTFGFTAFELQLFADWLESPDFPNGLHTLSASPK